MRLLFLFMLIGMALPVMVNAASSYPGQSIKVIVPNGAGGSTDRLSRLMVNELNTAFDVGVAVINIPGGGTSKGAQQVARSKADGYTLLSTHEALLTSSALKINRLGIASLTPVAQLGPETYLIAVPKDSPITDLASFYAAAKDGIQGKRIKIVVNPGAANHFFLMQALAPVGEFYPFIADGAALGVMVSLFFTWRSGRLRWTLLQHCFVQTAKTSGMILLIITTAFVLNLTISLTGVADVMTEWVTSFGLSPVQMLLALMVFYFVLGMFMDVLSMMVATIPITFPIVSHMGVDPVWFGIFIVLMCELGLITPPVGMNLFVVHGIRPDKGSISDAMWGAVPYVLIMLAFTLLLIAVPGIATWLPAQMKAG